MGRIQWARAAQFNWVFDNMGGTPLQEAVAGNWSRPWPRLKRTAGWPSPPPTRGAARFAGSGGYGRLDTVFPWDGFWAEPMGGDLTNYYPGGSFTNQGD